MLTKLAKFPTLPRGARKRRTRISPVNNATPGHVLPSPSSLIDDQIIEDAAFSTVRGTLSFDEAREHVDSFHLETANAEFSHALGYKREEYTQAQEELEAVSIRAAEVETYRNSVEQFTDNEPGLEKRQPWSPFIGFEFGVLFVSALIALVNGALAIASYLLARPEYADGTLKAFGIGLSILLLPSMTLTLVYHFLRRTRPKLATAYALILFGLVGVCVLVFIVTFGFSNAQSSDVGEISLADIGVVDLDSPTQPAIFEYLPAIALIFQILTDLLAAAAAKIGLVYLWENHGWVFRPKNPTFHKQSKELFELKTRRGEVKARFERLGIELEHLNEEREKFGQRVSKLADTVFCRKYQAVAAFKDQFKTL